MKIDYPFNEFRSGKINLIKIILLFFFSSLLLGPAFSQTRIELEQIQSEIKKPGLKMGQIILIGIISPELEELLFSEKGELIPRETEAGRELSEDERAELKKKLEKLLKEKDILSGDFYGINQFGHRYAMIFDRLGYIRYRLTKVNEEIAEIKKKIKN